MFVFYPLPLSDIRKSWYKNKGMVNEWELRWWKWIAGD
jgi:hypothetical protein